MDARSPRWGLTALFLGWAALAAIQPAIAEEAPVAAREPRVRVTTAQGRRVGRLVTIGDEILVLERAGRKDTLEIRRPEVLALEISERPSRRGRGATIGGLVGLGAAVAIGVLGGDTCTATPRSGDLGESQREAQLQPVPEPRRSGPAQRHPDRARRGSPRDCDRARGEVAPRRGGGSFGAGRSVAGRGRRGPADAQLLEREPPARVEHERALGPGLDPAPEEEREDVGEGEGREPRPIGRGQPQRRLLLANIDILGRSGRRAHGARGGHLQEGWIRNPLKSLKLHPACGTARRPRARPLP